MTIHIYNTLNKKKEIFKPVKQDKVTMYVCGPTVYSDPHIGNARAALIPDIFFRVLQKEYNDVIYIRNITDVDDKISDAAFAQNLSVYEISQKFIDIYQNNMSSIGILDPTHQPRVTDNIPIIIETIEKILNNGFAYVAEDHVIFDTQKYEKYGELSKRDLDEMIDGIRIDVASYKKSPRDFVLWKPSSQNHPGWESPWGTGRPGWHIECTSMIKKIIGSDETLDIHGGGNDLIFPHHENEIAQGNCASETNYCNYWFHNGIVLVNKKKMSKSIGNVILVSELLKNETPMTIRLALLSAHYRQPLNWSDSTLSDSRRVIDKFSNILLKNGHTEIIEDNAEIFQILSDDLNTPEAIKFLSLLSKHAGKNKKDYNKFLSSCNFLGLDLMNNKQPVLSNNLNEKLILKLIKDRNAARDAKDFTKADEIRNELAKMNIELEDLEDKTVWKLNRS